MVGLSEADVFTARELSARGFRGERIAVLLAVDLSAVEVALRAGGESAGDTAQDVAPVDEVVASAPVELPAAPRWPPPVTESTVWSVIRLPVRPSVSVRLRKVWLWGQLVSIDAGGGVYCPGCGDLRSTEELSGPDSLCSVGLRRGASGVPKPFDVDAEPFDARYLPVSDRQSVDFLRVQW